MAGGLERARADLARLAHEISRTEATLRALQSRADKVRVYVEMAQVYDAEDGDAEVPRIRGGISGAAVRAVVDAIRERKAPIHTRELLDILERQGIQIGGGNPVANLSGFLSRSEELRSSRSMGWALAEWGVPPDEGAATPDETSPVIAGGPKSAALREALRQRFSRAQSDAATALSAAESTISKAAPSSELDDAVPF